MMAAMIDSFQPGYVDTRVIEDWKPKSMRRYDCAHFINPGHEISLSSTDTGYFLVGLGGNYVRPEWYAEAFAKLTQFTELPEGWNGPACVQPSEVAVSSAKDFLRELSLAGIEPDGFAPSAQGGMGFAFSGVEDDVFVEFLNSGQVFASFAAVESEPEDFTPIVVPNTKEGRNDLIQRLDNIVNASCA